MDNSDKHYMSRERWEAIVECKKKFLLDPLENPHTCLYMKPEVADSWIKCRNLKVDSNKKENKQHLTPPELTKILERNQLLINITRPLLTTFKDLVIPSSGYVLQLYSTNCVTLLQEGEWEIFPEIVNLETRKYAIWNETVLGTTSHLLSLQSKRPVQLLGPENYNIYFHNNTASSAPIMDDDGEVIAVLTLVQPLIDPPWEEHLQDLYSHTLGLITAMAVAIETQIKLNKSCYSLKDAYMRLEILNNNLKTSNDTLKTTLASIDESIVTMDKTGNIHNINQEGKRLLNLGSGSVENCNIRSFLSKHSDLIDLVGNGENVKHLEETIFADNYEHPCLIDIWPVKDQTTDQVEMVVLRLNTADKVNALVTSRSGATASLYFSDIIGESQSIKKAINLGKIFAKSSENIFLSGESGTGKEIFAQAIHNQYCPKGPFMAVNCAAMPRELIESELFGYEGGSFTGAERNGRPGKIELAQGGTLFLDEIGDMPIELQAVLLRALEDKQIMRIGGRQYKKVDFRLIAATNKDLDKMVINNQFREDLYFRLTVLSINLPPLRERDNDIEIFSKYFVKKYSRKLGWPTPEISPAVQMMISRYDWPGNVRQMQNSMIYAVNMSQGNVITPECLPAYVSAGARPVTEDRTSVKEDHQKSLTLREYEKSAIEYALRQANNNAPLAADTLGISRSTIYRKIKEHKIEM